MKPFRFTLEAVATTRRRLEQTALENYAQALLARQNALGQLEAVQRELDAAWLRLRQTLESGCSASAATRLRQHSAGLEEERHHREDLLTQAQRKVGQALQQMLAARQQREAVEKFRGRQRASWDRDVQRDTQKFLDELATQRAAPALTWRTTTDPLA
ncbi:MAG: flagellar export protein FliJ [Verrucomicrobiota bacterium]